MLWFSWLRQHQSRKQLEAKMCLLYGWGSHEHSEGKFLKISCMRSCLVTVVCVQENSSFWVSLVFHQRVIIFLESCNVFRKLQCFWELQRLVAARSLLLLIYSLAPLRAFSSSLPLFHTPCILYIQITLTVYGFYFRAHTLTDFQLTMFYKAVMALRQMSIRYNIL